MPTEQKEELFRINNTERVLESAKKKLLESGIAEENKKLIKDFIRDKKLGFNGYGTSNPILVERETKYWSKLKKLSEIYEEQTNKKLWSAINVDDVKNLAETVIGLQKERQLNVKGKGIVTVSFTKTVIRKVKGKEVITEEPRLIDDVTADDYKKCLKCFIRWLKKDKFPPEINYLPTKEVKSKYENEEVELLNWDDIALLGANAINYRDKAFPWVLFDIPNSIGTTLQVRLKDVKPVEYETINERTGVKQVVRTYKIFFRTGKTKARVRNVTTTRSSAALGNWLRMHPARDNPEAPLWIDLGDWDKPLNVSAATRMLQRLAARAGLKKHVNPHFFRHSSFTYWHKKMNQANLEKRGGLSPGSKALRKHYIHTKEAEADEEALATEGLRPIQVEKEDWSVCKWCGHKNPPAEGNTCMNCQSPLDLSYDELMGEVEIRKLIDENYLSADKVKSIIDTVRDKASKELKAKVQAA